MMTEDNDMNGMTQNREQEEDTEWHDERSR